MEDDLELALQELVYLEFHFSGPRLPCLQTETESTQDMMCQEMSMKAAAGPEKSNG